MKTTQYDTTWYVAATRKIAEAEALAETERILARLDVGHIYLVEFESGVIKVGKSTDPANRIATHALLARAHGGGMRQSWVSTQHFYCGQSERELIDFCSREGRLAAGREYFHIPFARAVSRASLLAHNRLSPADLSMPWQEAHERLATTTPGAAVGATAPHRDGAPYLAAGGRTG